MASSELQTFLEMWQAEAQKTIALLRVLPAGQYDFRPDPGGRSLGELAWHLAEADGYVTYGIELGTFAPGSKPPGIERPKAVEALAPGYERIHKDAVARVQRLRAEDLDKKLRYFDTKDRTVRDLLWSAMLFHNIHHRGQLSMLCRMAGGVSPGMFGPNREEFARLRAAARAAAAAKA
jgi:uncharacterized damage-inducible protein DinB